MGDDEGADLRRGTGSMDFLLRMAGTGPDTSFAIKKEAISPMDENDVEIL